MRIDRSRVGEAPRKTLHAYVTAVVTGSALMFACSGTAPTPVARTLTTDWPLSISASPSCLATLPFGYGVAPRGGGRASLVQSGSKLSGALYISGTPSGALDGTVSGDHIEFTFYLDGRNVGVLKPEDEPCRVSGRATGTTDGYCWASVKISGEFACPYACSAPDHMLVFDRGRGCR